MKVEDIQENYITGWISIYRSLILKGWYKKSDYLHLWIHILIKATHKGIEFMFNGKNLKLNPGQFVTGRKVLSMETGINENKIERILTFFEKNEQQIEQQKTNRNRLITILNWNQYQQSEQQIEQPVNNKRTTSEQQVNTYNNDNNYNNEKNDNNKYSFNFKKSLINLGVENRIADEWLKVRKTKRAVNTETAFNNIKSQIDKSGIPANECIIKAVENSWGGFNADWIVVKSKINYEPF